MTHLTPDERAVLAALPGLGAKPAIARDSNAALRLAKRGYAVPTKVHYLSFPLFALSSKGVKALAVSS